LKVVLDWNESKNLHFVGVEFLGLSPEKWEKQRQFLGWLAGLMTSLAKLDLQVSRRGESPIRGTEYAESLNKWLFWPSRVSVSSLSIGTDRNRCSRSAERRQENGEFRKNLSAIIEQSAGIPFPLCVQ
jgi:hypothetical protein